MFLRHNLPFLSFRSCPNITVALYCCKHAQRNNTAAHTFTSPMCSKDIVVLYPIEKGNVYNMYII